MNETLNLIFKAFAKGTLQKLFPSCFSVRLLKQIPNSKAQKPDISSSIIANSGEREYCWRKAKPHCWAGLFYLPSTSYVWIIKKRGSFTNKPSKAAKRQVLPHVWEGHTLKVLELPSSSFRTDFSQGSNGDLDQQSPKSLDVWIELDGFWFDKLDSSNSN